MAQGKTFNQKKKHGDFSKFIKNKKNSTPQIEEEDIKPIKKGHTKSTLADNTPDFDSMRLNKFIANSGICSRREADKLIEAGKIRINSKIITALGTKVSSKDIVTYNKKILKSESLVYVLLNKPKGFITTTDDPFERKTVMSLVKKSCPQRIFPVGRLDRNTTGLLLFTNDGDLAKKLTHPKHDIKKIYYAILDKPLERDDLEKIATGINLEDGFVKADKISYIIGVPDEREIGIELHSGKNQIIRRIFQSLGYEVTKLDRVSFSGLTKKDIPRGKWRFLKDKEVSMLKMIS